MAAKDAGNHQLAAVLRWIAEEHDEENAELLLEAAMRLDEMQAETKW